MGRSERRRWAGVYVRGLLLDGERKSVEPMASRLGQSDQDLHHFVSHSPWSADTLLKGLARATATASPAYWIIDETSFPKAGDHSAGVQRQYCGALGKKANCQIAVSLHRADEQGGTSQPLAWRLYLPESWSADPIRRQRAGIPPQMVHHSKLDLALGLIDQALGWQMPAGIVLADEAYGGSFEWRAALRGRSLRYCVRVSWTTTAWSEEPRFGVPALLPRGQPASRRPLLSPEPKNLLAIAGALPASAWKRVTWRHGSKGTQRRLRHLEPVGRQRLAAGSATRARGRDRPHRVARRGACPHALLAGRAGTQALPTQARGHSTRTLAGGTGLPRAKRRTGPGPL